MPVDFQDRRDCVNGIYDINSNSQKRKNTLKLNQMEVLSQKKSASSMSNSRNTRAEGVVVLSDFIRYFWPERLTSRS